MYEEDDDDDFPEELERRGKELQKQLQSKARQEFIQGCYQAYDILEKQGEKALEQGDLNSICRAIDRMMTLFLAREEYERCSFLKKYVERNIPGHVITPDPVVTEQMNL